MRFLPGLVCWLLIPNLMPQDVPPASPPSISNPAPYVERDEKVFNFYPGGKINIAAGAPGNLKVVGWKKGSVRVEIEKIFYNLSPEEAKAELKKSPVRVRWTQTSSTIRTPENPEGKIEVNLTVYVPAERTDISAKIYHGDLSIEGINGWVETTITTEGSITAKSMSSYFSALTPRGDIAVDLEGIRWEGLELAAVTQNGSVALTLPEKYSAALQLETRDGKIDVDYPPQIVEGEEVPPDIVIRGSSQSLKASVGDGGAPIKLVTYSGDIRMSKR